MNDEAAETRGPSGPSQDAPAPSEPTSTTTPPGAWTPPEADQPPPPWGAPGSSFSRSLLVRPKQGRYIAGVCAALARATNTDPILWRVLLAVLGLLSGVGVLLYLIGWLIIPAEGDTASPIEGLLGKGRSGMAPLSVVLLGAAAVLSFAFIVQDGVRASILAAAVVLGAILLIKRTGPGTDATFPATVGPATAGPAAGTVPPDPVATEATAEFAAPPYGTTTPPAEEPLTAPLFTPPFGGYRPPFAPHGPYAPATEYAPPPPPLPTKPPKPPKEKPRLSRLTFFAVLVVIGVMALIDLAGATIPISGYFAAALVTIAGGLIVGAWFGRARGLIFLAILTSIGLGVTNGIERWGGDVQNNVYRPDSIAAIADRYDFTVGVATLDLRGIDFDGQQQTITATMKVGQLRVLLPADVDTTTTLNLKNGRADILGHEFDDKHADGQAITDLGADGAGGGTLRLDLQMDTGNVEVSR